MSLSKKMIKSITVGLIAALYSISSAHSQGISFSYLIPKNGYLSAPISPFSIRGIGIGGLVGLETGISLYSMPGLTMSGLPFDSNNPLTGQSWSFLIPGQATLTLGFDLVQIKLLAGGFFIWHANTRMNKGNLDREIAKYENWDIATSSLQMENKPGVGLMGGIGFEFKVNKKFSITSEVQYLNGQSDSSLKGSYAGGNIGDIIVTKEANYETAKTDLQGFEISLGVKF